MPVFKIKKQGFHFVIFLYLDVSGYFKELSN